MLQPAASTAPPPEARCAEHADTPAILICTRCGSYTCEPCRRVAADGREYCERCSSKVYVLASRGSRLVAAAVDHCFVVLPWMVMMFIQDLTPVGVVKPVPVVSAEGPLARWGMLMGLVMGSIQLYLVARKGQSVGKRLMGIRVVRTDGRPVELWRTVLLRALLPVAVNHWLGYVGLVDVLVIFAPPCRCLHDLLADTRVIRAE